MKTKKYNPSELEVQFAIAISALSESISDSLPENDVVDVTSRLDDENPSLIFHLKDTDGDKHEMVIKFIQRPDK